MQLKHTVALALGQLAQLGAAESGDASSNRSLANALASQNATLSTLNSLLNGQPALVSALNKAKNITILAPSNDAFSTYLSGPGASVSSDSGAVAALLSYHVVNGAYYADNLLALDNGTRVFPTLLTNESYANVTGGQRLGVSSTGGAVHIVSGLGTNATVTTPNVNFTGGTIHIIDHVLTIPPSDTSLLSVGNLTALAGALTQANLGLTVSDFKDITLFAPTNAAFGAISDIVANLSTADLSNILTYHVVQGQVLYAQDIKNGSTVQAVNKGTLTLTTQPDGSVFVNGAKVVTTNQLVANGVVHLIDNVLNPNNSSATPPPSATSGSPAFGPAPTGSHPSLAAAGLCAPGAVAVAALCGGLAVLVNVY